MPKLNIFNIDNEMVHKNLESLKIEKSPGPDGLSTIILIVLACVLAGPLIIMFKKSLKTATLPNVWKKANITAILKKGDTKILVTCMVCKMLESITREQTIKHMKNQNLFF